MKKIIVTTMTALMFSPMLFAAADESIDDQIYGSRPTTASRSEPWMAREGKHNNEQKEDLMHGYGPKTTAFKGEQWQPRAGKQNNEQQEDVIHGYSR